MTTQPDSAVFIHPSSPTTMISCVVPPSSVVECIALGGMTDPTTDMVMASAEMAVVKL